MVGSPPSPRPVGVHSVASGEDEGTYYRQPCVDRRQGAFQNPRGRERLASKSRGSANFARADVHLSQDDLDAASPGASHRRRSQTSS